MLDNGIGLYQTLENINSISVLVLDVVVNGDDEHEDEEDASPAQEVPYVMPEKRNTDEIMGKRERRAHSLYVDLDRVVGTSRSQTAKPDALFVVFVFVNKNCIRLSGLR